jgi:hypothetical protein
MKIENMVFGYFEAPKPVVSPTYLQELDALKFSDFTAILSPLTHTQVVFDLGV